MKVNGRVIYRGVTLMNIVSVYQELGFIPHPESFSSVISVLVSLLIDQLTFCIIKIADNSSKCQSKFTRDKGNNLKIASRLL